jgi:hypothetical protein
VGEVGEREVDELVHAGERQRRLGALAGQYVEPATGAAGLDQSEDAWSGHARRYPAG